MRSGKSVLAAMVGVACLSICAATCYAEKAKVAEIKVKGSLPESPGAPGLFGDLEQNLSDMTSRLDRAAQDEDIQAVLLRLRNPSLGRGKVQEIRAAIARVRKQGKRVIADIEQGDQTDYMIASACDEIIMPESGVLMLPGIRAEVAFYKGLMDKLGIEADMMQVGDYKGAAEPLTRKSMSPAFRKQFESVIDDMFDQMVDAIAEDRGLSRARVLQLIDTGLFTAKQAKKAGLIDTVAYPDQLEQNLTDSLDVDEIDLAANYGKQAVNDDFSGMLGMVRLFEMLLGGEPSVRLTQRKKIAVVYVNGAITSGESTSSLFGASTVGSDTIVKALRQADKDDKVVAIVLRIDSPGGSALASDLIWRQIREIEKPVIASMGDTAASGGYYVAMGCDKIFAEPATLTGSIGVVGGKIAQGGLYDKVGVTTEVISRGKNSGLLAIDAKFSESERKAFQTMMVDIYEQFVAKAAQGREMDVEAIEKLAGGRLWSGRQAEKNGLIDFTGGLRDALKYAKQAAGIEEDEKVEVLPLPKPKSLLDELLNADSSPLAQAAGAEIQAAAPQVSERLQEIQTIERLFQEPGVLLSPYRVRIR